MFRSRVLFLLVLAMLAFESFAQTNNSYQQTNLVSDVNGQAAHTDSALVNPWGISFVPGQPFWIANNGTGTSTIYDGTGATQLQKVTVPAAAGTAGAAPITGTVANTTTGFAIGGIPSQFLFVSEDGTITGWTGGTNAVIAVDNSRSGAVYKGAAIGTNSAGNFLYTTNFAQNRVDVFDRLFSLARLTGNFSDPNLPAGYAPFGIANIGNNRLVITFALQDNTGGGDVAGAGHGFVDEFDTDGNFITRIASQGPLNSPWGIAVASANFGAFSNALLIGNFGDGQINAYDLGTHNLLGQLKDSAGQPVLIDGLWALAFGGGGLSGDADSLYFTAGLNGETHGLFGKLTLATSGSGSDFTIGTNQQSLTVTRGGTSTLSLAIGATSGFAGDVSLSCPSAPAGVTCSFTPNPVPAGAQATSMLTVSVNSGYLVQGRSHTLPFLGTTLVAGLFFGTSLRRKTRKAAGLIAIAIIGMMILLQSACSGSPKTAAGSVPLTVVGTSGNLTHSTTVSLSIQ